MEDIPATQTIDILPSALGFLMEIPLSIQELSQSSKEKGKNKGLQDKATFPSLLEGKADRNIVYKRSVSTYNSTTVEKVNHHKRSSILLDEATLQTNSNVLDSLSIWTKNRSILKNPIVRMKYVSNAKLLNCRLCFLESGNRTPLVLVSVKPYSKDKKYNVSNINTGKDQDTSQTMLLLSHKATKQTDDLNISFQSVTSYKSLLGPSSVQLKPVPIDIKSSEWTTGKHRKVLGLKCYLVSILQYTKPSELKRNLNTKFKQSFPNIGVTLSKIRSLENQMHHVTKQFGLHTGVLGCAVNWFERLLFGEKVIKSNRHLVAAACVLLSGKVHGDLKTDELSQMFSALEHSFKCDRDEILKIEFPVFASLEFSLIL